eukprot:Gregarina_sp_Poly_1__2435@NODE_1655_length_3619_cov_47_485079_g1089_i0_p1_GENE_NODE_1655_length_3619_cov_47_485079_g1089_i0NODE_1655_length_3619_cov_47_485079_g1089_i0_p1_ORF_typecomplete_len904_score148_80SNF2_N/PF00176_23/2_3e45ResIII/PF04851_15/2_9e12ResIII/PF04851_15/1_1e03Helicase_C/PF00271_31/7_7e12DEAD/PF00270_29/1_3e05ERCC3_RAD25_C/PF16203_5/3e03ERCC3_RAD25_C/PF16203_5/7_1e05Flavi_DEAD/PF07652_14/0_0029Flavi_DEAD/PF07652_14/1_1e04DEAD_2/PF06733_15/1_9DEAD_2/PF06733_15/57Herpes_ori_bp/PF0
MSDDTVCQFGKHRGKSFAEILKVDPSYCAWALKADNPGGGLGNFRAWLLTKNVPVPSSKSTSSDSAIKRQLDHHHGIAGMSTDISFEPRMLNKRQREEQEIAQKQSKKGRFSTWLDDGLETAYNDDLSSGGESVCYEPEDFQATEEDHSLKALDKFGWGSKSTTPRRPLNPMLSKPVALKLSRSVKPSDIPQDMTASPKKASLVMQTQSASTHAPSAPVSNAAERWLSSAMPKQSSAPEQSNGPQQSTNLSNPCSFKGTVVLEVCSPDAFRIQVENKKGGRSSLTTYLPNELWNIVMKFKSPQVPLSKEGRPISGTCMTASRFQEFCQTLKQSLDRSVEIQTVPGFVLRAFPSFLAFAPPLSLQRKCANIFLKICSPKTQEYSKEIKSRLGPLLLRELKVFQMDGISFGLERNGRVLIGDEMGLGKTLQALAILSIYQKEWPCLVVCPSSIRFQWKDQAQRWLRHCFCEIDEELFIVRNGKTKITNKAKMIIISYELLTKMTSLHHGIKVIVCDESHYLKSATAKRSQIIVPMLQSATRAILLSGTPALNKPSELYQQLIGVMPDFARYEEFSDRYCEKKRNPWSNKMEYHSSKLTDELNLFLTSSIMIRRLKKDVQQELPDKIRSRIPVELDPTLAKEVFAKMKNMDRKSVDSDAFDATNEDAATNEGQTRALISNLFRLTGEAKANSVCEYIDYISEIEDKFIIFGHHKSVLDKIEAKLRLKKFSFVRIDGSTPQNHREGLVKKFQETGEARIALLSITACGHGLNMTAAGTAVFAELYWVPGQIMQAEDRCHRMGTTHSTINIHYCIAEKTIDDIVWNCLDRKWNGISSTLDGQKQQFQDDKLESHKHAAWKAHVPNKVVERRQSLLIVEDIVNAPLALPAEPGKLEKRQSLLDDFVLDK